MYWDPNISSSENQLRSKQEALITLQTEKLRRENNGRIARENAEIVAVLFAVIAVVFVFAFKRPKTFIVMLALAYGAFQFLAPVQGHQFNSWVVTLVENPTQARAELFATLKGATSNDVSAPISGDGGATPFDADNDAPVPAMTAPVASAPTLLLPVPPIQDSVPTPAAAPAPIPAAAQQTPAVNSMCSQFKWSNPDDLPYLHYYKCPNPGSGE